MSHHPTYTGPKPEEKMKVSISISVYASKASALKALIKESHGLIRDIENGKHATADASDSLYHKLDDRDCWVNASHKDGYEIQEHTIISEGGDVESRVWIQKLRNDGSNVESNATISIEGVYCSSDLAIDSRSPDLAGENYRLQSYNIQE